MVNGVRFGLVGGRSRLVAAEQSGYVYVLESPPRGCPPDALADALVCTGLGEPSERWGMRPVSRTTVLSWRFWSASAPRLLPPPV